MADLMTLSDLAARADERFALPFCEGRGLRAFRAEAPVPVDFDPDDDSLPEATSLVGFGWTDATPGSSYSWFELRACAGGHLVLASDDSFGENVALVRLEGDLSAEGLGTLLEALGDAIHTWDEPPRPLGFEASYAWPTEVEGVYPELPRSAVQRFVRRFSSVPDPYGSGPAQEFGEMDETASDAAVEAAFDRYFARILPPA